MRTVTMRPIATATMRRIVHATALRRVHTSRRSGFIAADSRDIDAARSGARRLLITHASRRVDGV